MLLQYIREIKDCKWDFVGVGDTPTTIEYGARSLRKSNSYPALRFFAILQNDNRGRHGFRPYFTVRGLSRE
jgi:hypothetical protein